MITNVGMFEYFNDQLRQYWQQATWDLGSGCVYLGLDWSQWSQWSCHYTVSLSLSGWLVTRQTKKRFSRPQSTVTQAPGWGHEISSSGCGNCISDGWNLTWDLWIGILTWTFNRAFHLLYFMLRAIKRLLRRPSFGGWSELEAEFWMSPNLLLLGVTRTRSVRWLGRHKRCYQMAPLVLVIRIMPAHHYKSSTDTDLKGLFWAAPQFSAHCEYRTGVTVTIHNLWSQSRDRG